MTQPDNHYFSRDPQSESQRRTIETALRGERWSFVTDTGMFSPGHIDPGSRLLVEAMEIEPGERVLDVGAGYGPVGLVAARLTGETGLVTMVEINQRAADLIVENAVLNSVTNYRVVVSDLFEPGEVGEQDVVVTNPPTHAGKQMVLELLHRAAASLRMGGRMYLVGHKYLGVKSLQAELERWMGPVDLIDKGAGYRVILCVKTME
ncbi:MAG: class I SAM-dependent methyltransferase [Armatimonadetes bacterium]|nr:class I SAM-dependent methyltransferase [Armatimonadota bacterium]